jgi:hypothetical protein
MIKKIQLFFRWINDQNLAVLIFILAMANFFGYSLEGGEEQYFAFAKQYMNPGWMPNSFVLNHPAGGNMAFHIVVGYLLKYISFEQMAAIGRTLNFLMMAFPLALIFRKLCITNIEALFLLQVIFFGHQSLYAGEWIFKNFEEKTIAYVFVFWSLNFLLDDRPIISAVFAAAGTYFHFLVGGWMFCFVFLFAVVWKKKTLPVALTALVYTMIVLPLIYYLYHIYFINNPPIINGVNTNAIYAFWRLKHHIGIFHNFHYFVANSLWGVLITLFLYVFCLTYPQKLGDQNIRKLNTLNLIIFTQQFFFMIVALFDKNGVLMKTYPFRTNSLSVFLILLELTLIIKYWSSWYLYPSVINSILKSQSLVKRKAAFSAVFNTLLLLIMIPVFIYETSDMFRNITSFHHDLDEPMMGMIGYIKKNTPGSSVFIFPDSDRPYSFIRRAERERFVVEKFTPTTSAAIYEWYKRAQMKERIKQDISLIDSVSRAYQIDYMVSDSLYTYPSLILEKEFGNHKLYRIIR